MPGVAAELAAGRFGTGRGPAGVCGTGSAVNPLVRCGVVGRWGTGRDAAPTAHNPEVEGSNPSPATITEQGVRPSPPADAAPGLLVPAPCRALGLMTPSTRHPTPCDAVMSGLYVPGMPGGRERGWMRRRRHGTRSSKGAGACSSANQRTKEGDSHVLRHHRRPAIAALAVPAGVASPPIPGPLSDVARPGHLTEWGQGQHAQYQVQVQAAVRLHRLGPGGRSGRDHQLAQPSGPGAGDRQGGTFTLYDSDDRKCRPHRYGPGQALWTRAAATSTSTPITALLNSLWARHTADHGSVHDNTRRS